MRQTRVQSLVREDLLAKEMATHSSTLAWKIPWMGEPGRLQMWSHKESDTTEQLHFLSLCSIYFRGMYQLLFFLLIYFNRRLTALQYYAGFCPTLTWISYGCTCVPHPDPHASNLDWWSSSYMIIYMFQCYSPKSSHPCLLPQSPKVCSLHLCLFCCLAYRVIITIFLNSIYMR